MTPPTRVKQSHRQRVTGLVEFNTKKRRKPEEEDRTAFLLCVSPAEVRSHRADTGLVLRLKAGLGAGLAGETCL